MGQSKSKGTWDPDRAAMPSRDDDAPSSNRPAGSIATASSTAVNFPNQFTVWYKGSRSNCVCYLGFYQDKSEIQPLYVVAMPDGYQWEGPLLLHAGPNTQFPVVATLSRNSESRKNGKTATVEFMGRKENGIVRSEVAPRRYSFTFPLDGRDEEKRVYEWRSGKGMEVKSVGAGKEGWELVKKGLKKKKNRETRGVQNGTGGEEYSEEAVLGKWEEREDEILAVWGTNWKGSRAGEIKFVEGAEVDRLGMEFKVVMVLAMLYNWHDDMIRRFE